jgi:hypothetical protein
MEVLFQALIIIFEVQMKRSNKQISKNNNLTFQLTKCVFFSSLDPSYFQSF